MNTTIFKRLFEIRLLHDYFLTAADGVSFFDGNEADRKEVLETKLSYNLYDIRDIFFIEPIGATMQRINEYKLVLRKTALGLVVGIEVKTEHQAGEIRYRPRYSVNEAVNLTFSIRPKTAFFKSITNLHFRTSLPAVYYFTNKDRQEFDEAVAPAFKSLPIVGEAMEHQDGKTYEMGALINFGGTLREALQHTDGNTPAHWEDTTDKRFVTEADRKLLPHIFNYDLEKGDNITQFEALLEDESHTEIKTISRNSPEAMGSVLLNFAKVDETDEASEDIAAGFYQLKIKLSGGPEIVYPVYLNDDIYQRGDLGVIDIRFDETDSPFSLLDASGFLKARIDASNQKIPHPVFEIRFKNRRTYWRYSKEEDFTAEEKNGTNTHLEEKSPNILISKKPRALTETLTPFKNGTSLILPHPRTPAVKVENEKVFSDIFINQSNRLLSN